MKITDFEQTQGNGAIKDAVECIGKSWSQGRHHTHKCALRFSNHSGKKSLVNGTIEFHYDDNFPYVEISGISDVIEHSNFSCQYQLFKFSYSEKVLSITGVSRAGVKYSINVHLDKKFNLSSRMLI